MPAPAHTVHESAGAPQNPTGIGSGTAPQALTSVLSTDALNRLSSPPMPIIALFSSAVHNVDVSVVVLCTGASSFKS
jgi:hypothetical protein